MSLSSRYGIAIDLGTTTFAAALISLPDGDVAARSGALNPQRVHGLDVISRLEYAGRSGENLREMQCLVNRGLAALANGLMLSAGVDKGAVERISLAANPTMTHLLLGLPTDSIAHPPYRPRITAAHALFTREIGWETDFPLYVFPSPGGFVGGDTIAFLYGLGFPRTSTPEPRPRYPEPALFLDLGTNGEIALLAEGKLYATSAAAGPAFEGGNLSCGMAALPGAISLVEAHAGRLVMATIAAAPPKGLCGSGVLDTVALLLTEGLLDVSGRLVDPSETSSPLGSRLQEIAGGRCFVIYRDARTLVALTQDDIRQIQLAKGAVRGAMEVLFERANVAGADLEKIVLTGSFGASIRFESLKTVGVLSQNMVEKTDFVREGALAGALRALTETDYRQQLENLSLQLKIIPLSGTPVFENHFMNNIGFQV